MEDFEALINSLGESTLDYLSVADVTSVVVYPDRLTGSAHIEIFLSKPSWAAQSLAIDKMIEIRQMFIDEISIDYAFIDGDDTSDATATSRAVAFAA